MGYFQDLNQSRQFRHRSILLFIILATLPCYIVGAIMLGVAPEDEVNITDNETLPPPDQNIITSTATATLGLGTPSMTPNPSATIGNLGPTPRQFQTPTPVILPTNSPTATATGTHSVTPSPTATTTATTETQNTPPVFDVQPADITLQLNGTQTVPLSFSDPDGDNVSFTAISNNTTIASITQFGETSFDVMGLAPGEALITITLIDGQGAQNSATITATVLSDNTPPIFDPAPGDVTVKQNESVTVALAFRDADGDTVVFRVNSADPAIATTTPVDAQSFTVTGVAPGVTTATITLNDGHGGTAQATITITVNASDVNSNPVFLTLPPPLILNEGDSTVVTLQFSDPDNDPVTFVAEGADPSIATVAALNDVSFSVTGVDTGETTVNIYLDDGQGGAASHIMPVTVNAVETNNPPTFTFVPELITIGVGDSDIVIVETSDPDGDSVTLTVVPTDPTIITATKLDNTSFTIQGLAQGTTTISLTLTDGRNGRTQAIVPTTVTTSLEE